MPDVLVRYPGPGCIVEFLQGNAVSIALVLEEQGGKLRLLLPNRRELPLQSNRLLPWAGPLYSPVSSKDDGVALLEKHKAARDAARTQFDAQGLWELAQGEVDRASAQWFAELVLSAPTCDDIAACGHTLLECKSHFKFQPPEFEVFSQALAELRHKEAEATQAREKLAQQGMAWFAHLWELHSKKARLVHGEVRHRPEEAVYTLLSSMVLDKVADPENNEHEALWRLLTKNLPDDPFVPLYLAQAWGLVPLHYNVWLNRADYASGDLWAQEHAGAVAGLVAAAQQAVNPSLSSVAATLACSADVFAHLLSIDSPTTRDIDDAFYVEALADGGWHATIALACPALHWPFDSELDKAVQHRATSLYLPEETCHMLPEALGAAAYSLIAGQTRPAFVVHCRVAADGSLGECQLECRQVRLAANATYEAVQAFFDGAASFPDNAASLSAALQLAKTRQNRRIADGAVIIERPEPQIIAEAAPDGDYTVRIEEDVMAPAAHLVVGELMILANASLARWANKRGVPLLYRTQHVNVPKDFAGIWSEPQDIARVVRALAPAVLETQAKPHAGVAEALYAPTTSPLRRYPDLINQAQLLHVLHTGGALFAAEALEKLLNKLSMRLDAAQQVQRFRPRYWKLLYISRKTDKYWWPAVVTDEGDQYAGVILPAEQLQVRAKRALFGTRVFAGQRLEVRLNKIHPWRGEVSLTETREIADERPVTPKGEL